MNTIHSENCPKCGLPGHLRYSHPNANYYCCDGYTGKGGCGHAWEVRKDTNSTSRRRRRGAKKDELLDFNFSEEQSPLLKEIKELKSNVDSLTTELNSKIKQYEEENTTFTINLNRNEFTTLMTAHSNYTVHNMRVSGKNIITFESNEYIISLILNFMEDLLSVKFTL